MEIGSSLTRLARRFDLADLYVFGSRAKEIAARSEGKTVVQTRSASDVDIGVRPSVGKKLSAAETVAIAVELEDLLEVNRVDLVVLPGCDPFLALDVIRGELLYTSDPGDQAQYELYIMRRAGDLAPFKKARIDLVMEGRGQ
jgi:predicted nucleotidyltransferase